MNVKGHDSVSGNQRIVETEIDKRREWDEMREKERERVTN
jgi:hypothetical protein